MYSFSPETHQRFQARLAQARAGSQQACDDMVLPFKVALRRYARKHRERRLQGKVDDSDLLQMTIVKAFEHLHQFQGSTLEEFGCWLLGIMGHTISDQSRKYRGPERDVSKEVPLESVWDRLTAGQAESAKDETCQGVKAALDKLPEPYRKVIVWHYYEKKSHQQIGNLLGVSANAAKHRCHRAIGKLGKELSRQRGG